MASAWYKSWAASWGNSWGVQAIKNIIFGGRAVRKKFNDDDDVMCLVMAFMQVVRR